MTVDQIIIEPVLTEKANRLRDAGMYVFHVNARANKIEIMKAVKQLFGVHPVACNTVNVKGKPKRLRFRKGYTATWKKAIVTLSEGEKITVFEGA
jgi:large subunit ribosomal protein L23